MTEFCVVDLCGDFVVAVNFILSISGLLGKAWDYITMYTSISSHPVSFRICHKACNNHCVLYFKQMLCSIVLIQWSWLPWFFDMKECATTPSSSLLLHFFFCLELCSLSWLNLMFSAYAHFVTSPSFWSCPCWVYASIIILPAMLWTPAKTEKKHHFSAETIL